MRDAYRDMDHGAVVTLMPMLDGKLLTSVEVHRQFRGNGYASALMKQVCEDADIECVTLYLSVIPDGTGLSERVLTDWYGKLGFRPFGDDDLPVRSMRRFPKEQL